MSLRKEDTELIKAAKAGDRDTCARLLQGNASDRAYVNGRGGLNSTALIEAAALGHIGIVELLLDNGANPNDKNMYIMHFFCHIDIHDIHVEMC